jgi:hypothetical protein
VRKDGSRDSRDFSTCELVAFLRSDARIALVLHRRIYRLGNSELTLNSFKGESVTFQVDYSAARDFSGPVSVEKNPYLLPFWLEVLPGETYRKQVSCRMAEGAHRTHA